MQRLLKNALENGSERAIEIILERVDGKVRQAIDHAIADAGTLSDDEKKNLKEIMGME